MTFLTSSTNWLEEPDNVKIGIIGLGYVGLPLLSAFFKSGFICCGYDFSKERVAEISRGFDRTNEIEDANLLSSLEVSSNLDVIKKCDLFIVTVPTPVDIEAKPDLTLLTQAVSDIAFLLKGGKVLVIESTVYPGVTEDVCVPLIVKLTGSELNKDFFVGYSPERINPGDADHSLSRVIKVVAGSSPECTEFLSKIYSRIVPAGIHIAESIRVAEMAKVIENTQRDVNVALMNEFCILADRLDIPFDSVRRAALTKWNFLDFTPGLVGGHCIGVDPYYLLHKAREVEMNLSLVSAARDRNESMARWLNSRVASLLAARFHGQHIFDVLLVGFTFKKNCPDVRNTKMADIVDEGLKRGWSVNVFDPIATPSEVSDIYNINMLSMEDFTSNEQYHAIIFGVAHDSIKELGQEFFKQKLVDDGVVVGLQQVFPHWRFDTTL